MQRIEVNCATGEQFVIDLTPEEIAALPVPTAADKNAPVIAQIDTLERTQLLPRISREFMLLQFEQVAYAKGVAPTTNAAYVKLKAFDDQISALRSQLV